MLMTSFRIKKMKWRSKTFPVIFYLNKKDKLQKKANLAYLAFFRDYFG